MAQSEMRRARALGKEAFLERALILMEQAEARCPQLRAGNAKQRAAWIIEGHMIGAARRWVADVARTNASVEEQRQSNDALSATESAGSALDLLKTGDDARAAGDHRLARRFYTRAMSAFDRDGVEVRLERPAHDEPLWPENRWPWAFSSKGGFFLDGREAPNHFVGSATLWSLERSQTWTYRLGNDLESAAVSPKGIVLFRTMDGNLDEWNPVLDKAMPLGLPPRGIRMRWARPGELPTAFSTDGSLMAMDTFLHRVGKQVLVARKDAVAFAITANGSRVVGASMTDVAGYAVPPSFPSMWAMEPSSLEPRWRFSIEPPLALDQKERRDIAISHDAKWLVTRDARGLTLYAIDETTGLTAVRLAKPLDDLAPLGAGPPAAGGVQFSESDRWVLVKDHAEDRVFPFGGFESASCVRGLRDALGFTTIAQREWVVTATPSLAAAPSTNPRWHLSGLPLDSSRCDGPMPTLEISHLDDELAHGHDALEIIAQLPCQGRITCPASGSRTQIEVRWTKDRVDRETWMSERYQCRVGGRALPWSMCALRFETTNVVEMLTPSNSSEG